ncbi:MAG: dephospho-CoA kinase [Ruminococcaceae bacterium]|nr:dephospho-CoA kinase [Oscillospiraceae bacterium]
MNILGLTGPTGAGKGAVGALLAQKGALIIDTDRLAREVVEKGTPCLAAITAHFGQDVLREDGTLNRGALAAKVFADPAEKAVLEAITHPAIIARTHELLAASDASLAVIDAPALFESGMDAICDTTLAVLAPAAVRFARILARDGISEEAAHLRMNAQPDDDFYRTRADHILINDGDEALLRERLWALLPTLWEEPV